MPTTIGRPPQPRTQHLGHAKPLKRTLDDGRICKEK